MEDNFYFYSFLYLLISLIFLIFLIKVVVHDFWWIPTRTEIHFMKQGIMSPKYEFFLGNLREISSLILRASSDESMPLSHDILPRVLSFFHFWKKIYGSMFLIWFGPTARLTISDPAIIREILFSKSEYFEKYDPPLQVKRIEGDGLLNLRGDKWAHHRKIMQPFFRMENLKLIAPIMAKTMEEALDKLSENMSNTGNPEIEISVWFQKLLEDVITKITFGSNYEEGLVISRLQAHQTAHATEAYQKAFIPGYRFLTTSRSRISRRLAKEIKKLLLKLIDRRRKIKNLNSHEYSSNEGPTDLLEVMMNAADESARSNDCAAVTDNDIVEECKTIFFAGTHTTSAMLTWTAVLLAMHRRWQDEAREEVLRVCGARDTPTKDDLAKLKLLGMIINESVRLYPPVVAMIRRAKANVHVSGVHIPEGTELLIPTIAVHHDSAQWGDDVHDFNPMRFAEGASRAAEHPMAFLPFGSGARRCIGQNLAILEAKLAISMILRRFSLKLAPKYRHSPSVLMILHPQHGAPIVFRKLCDTIN